MNGGTIVSAIQSGLHIVGTGAAVASYFAPQIGLPLQVAVGVAGGLVTLGASIWSILTPPAS